MRYSVSYPRMVGKGGHWERLDSPDSINWQSARFVLGRLEVRTLLWAHSMIKKLNYEKENRQN